MRAQIIVATLVLSSSIDAYAAEKVKVALVEVRGPSAENVGAAIVTALHQQSRIEVIGAEDAKKADATVHATTTKRGRNFYTTVQVKAGSAVLKTWSAKGKSPKKITDKISREFWKRVGSSILRLERPEEEEPEPVAEEKKPPTATASNSPTTSSSPATTPSDDATKTTTSIEPESPRKLRSETALGFTAGVNFLTRKFRYNDDIFGGLRPYTLTVAPAPWVEINWYPGAHFSDGFGAHIGIGLWGEYALGLHSEDKGGNQFPTKAQAFAGSLRGRIPFGASEVTLFAGAGFQSYQVQAAEGAIDPQVPGVEYLHARFGLEARFCLADSLHIGLRGAYRHVLSAGEITSDEWFARATLAGIDARAMISYEVVSGFDMVVAGEVRRYFYSFHPEPGDAKVAGGATDQFLAGTAGLAIHL